ncbi:MAG TPA: hypothetical protein VFK52_08865 [Nocardioidaceae bacterium]|nr:hypothetical protein [Nocardioidaceae bacterium]
MTRRHIAVLTVLLGLPTFIALGVARPAAAAEEELIVKYAPMAFLRWGESRWPMSSHTFVDHSSLKWEHAWCNDEDHVIVDMETIYEPYLASVYSHRQRTCYTVGAWQTIHVDPVFWTNDLVAPFQVGGPNAGEVENANNKSSEGMYMNLLNEYRDGQGFQGDEPVYVRHIDGKRLLYWFHYGESHLGLCPGCTHEGDGNISRSGWMATTFRKKSSTSTTAANAPCRGPLLPNTGPACASGSRKALMAVTPLATRTPCTPTASRKRGFGTPRSTSIV